MTGERAKESVKEIESGRERDSLGIEGDGEKLTVLFFGKERQTNWQTDHRQATALTTATQTLTLTLTHAHRRQRYPISMRINDHRVNNIPCPFISSISLFKPDGFGCLSGFGGRIQRLGWVPTDKQYNSLAHIHGK